jgi:uncharacterized protein
LLALFTGCGFRFDRPPDSVEHRGNEEQAMQTALRADRPVPIEEIIRELETARKLPEAALRAAIARADEIEPAVIAVIEAAADGALLLPQETNLALFGMHALAAARRTALYRPLVRMMRAVGDDDIEWLFSIDPGRTLPPILLSIFDGDASPLIETAMTPEVDGSTRAHMLLVLARLTFDGAIERSGMKALLERFERENLAKPDDLAWKGWQIAIALLGLDELRERIHALGRTAAIPSARSTSRPRTRRCRKRAPPPRATRSGSRSSF